MQPPADAASKMAYALLTASGVHVPGARHEAEALNFGTRWAEAVDRSDGQMSAVPPPALRIPPPEPD
ncbi:MAG: hypothetical protein AB8I08_38415 [Sandaracinaceae bacterium]